MKKKLLLVLVAMVGASALGGMDDISYCVTNGVVFTNSISLSRVVRGELEAVKTYVQTGCTNLFEVIVDGQTIFTKTETAGTGYYPIRAAMYSTVGAALTSIDAVAASGGSNTNIANTVLGKFPIAGTLTLRIAGRLGDGVTNSPIIKLIYKK